MSRKFKFLLLFISVATLLTVSFIASPPLIGLYYQLRGGQELDKVLRNISNSSELSLTCKPLPADKSRLEANVSASILNLKKAVDFYPDNSQAHLQLGRAYCLLGDLGNANKSFTNYSELRPNNPLGYLGLGFTYELLNNSSEAAIAWKKAGMTTKDFQDAGDEALEVGDYQNAKDWYSRSILMDPTNVQALINLGEVNASLNNADAALQSMRKAWEINPETSAANLASLLVNQSDFQAAEEVLVTVINDYPDSVEKVEWWKTLGEIYLAEKKYQEAAGVYQSAIVENPQDIDLHIALGWVYFNSNDSRKAESEFRQAIEINPTSGKGYFALAQLMNRNGKYADAEPHYQKAVEFSPGNRWYYLDRANNARQAGDYQSSVKYYQETLDRFPDFVQAYYHASLAYQLAGKEREAINMIKQAMKLMDPPDEDIFVRAGEIYRQAGFRERAITAYQNALKLDPENETAKKGMDSLAR